MRGFKFQSYEQYLLSGTNRSFPGVYSTAKVEIKVAVAPSTNGLNVSCWRLWLRTGLDVCLTVLAAFYYFIQNVWLLAKLFIPLGLLLVRSVIDTYRRSCGTLSLYAAFLIFFRNLVIVFGELLSFKNVGAGSLMSGSIFNKWLADTGTNFVSADYISAGAYTTELDFLSYNPERSLVGGFAEFYPVSWLDVPNLIWLSLSGTGYTRWFEQYLKDPDIRALLVEYLPLVYHEAPSFVHLAGGSELLSYRPEFYAVVDKVFLHHLQVFLTTQLLQDPLLLLRFELDPHFGKQFFTAFFDFLDTTLIAGEFGAALETMSLSVTETSYSFFDRVDVALVDRSLRYDLRSLATLDVFSQLVLEPTTNYISTYGFITAENGVVFFLGFNVTKSALAAGPIDSRVWTFMLPALFPGIAYHYFLALRQKGDLQRSFLVESVMRLLKKDLEEKPFSTPEASLLSLVEYSSLDFFNSEDDHDEDLDEDDEDDPDEEDFEPEEPDLVEEEVALMTYLAVKRHTFLQAFRSVFDRPIEDGPKMAPGLDDFFSAYFDDVSDLELVVRNFVRRYSFFLRPRWMFNWALELVFFKPINWDEYEDPDPQDDHEGVYKDWIGARRLSQWLWTGFARFFWDLFDSYYEYKYLQELWFDYDSLLDDKAYFNHRLRMARRNSSFEERIELFSIFLFGWILAWCSPLGSMAVPRYGPIEREVEVRPEWYDRIAEGDSNVLGGVLSDIMHGRLRYLSRFESDSHVSGAVFVSSVRTSRFLFKPQSYALTRNSFVGVTPRRKHAVWHLTRLSQVFWLEKYLMSSKVGGLRSSFHSEKSFTAFYDQVLWDRRLQTIKSASYYYHKEDGKTFSKVKKKVPLIWTPKVRAYFTRLHAKYNLAKTQDALAFVGREFTVTGIREDLQVAFDKFAARFNAVAKIRRAFQIPEQHVARFFRDNPDVFVRRQKFRPRINLNKLSYFQWRRPFGEIARVTPRFFAGADQANVRQGGFWLKYSSFREDTHVVLPAARAKGTPIMQKYKGKLQRRLGHVEKKIENSSSWRQPYLRTYQNEMRSGFDESRLISDFFGAGGEAKDLKELAHLRLLYYLTERHQEVVDALMSASDGPRVPNSSKTRDALSPKDLWGVPWLKFNRYASLWGWYAVGKGRSDLRQRLIFWRFTTRAQSDWLWRLVLQPRATGLWLRNGQSLFFLPNVTRPHYRFFNPDLREAEKEWFDYRQAVVYDNAQGGSYLSFRRPSLNLLPFFTSTTHSGFREVVSAGSGAQRLLGFPNLKVRKFVNWKVLDMLSLTYFRLLQSFLVDKRDLLFIHPLLTKHADWFPEEVSDLPNYFRFLNYGSVKAPLFFRFSLFTTTIKDLQRTYFTELRQRIVNRRAVPSDLPKLIVPQTSDFGINFTESAIIRDLFLSAKALDSVPDDSFFRIIMSRFFPAIGGGSFLVRHMPLLAVPQVSQAGSVFYYDLVTKMSPNLVGFEPSTVNPSTSSFFYDKRDFVGFFRQSLLKLVDNARVRQRLASDLNLVVTDSDSRSIAGGSTWGEDAFEQSVLSLLVYLVRLEENGWSAVLPVRLLCFLSAKFYRIWETGLKLNSRRYYFYVFLDCLQFFSAKLLSRFLNSFVLGGRQLSQRIDDYLQVDYSGVPEAWFFSPSAKGWRRQLDWFFIGGVRYFKRVLSFLEFRFQLFTTLRTVFWRIPLIGIRDDVGGTGEYLGLRGRYWLRSARESFYGGLINQLVVKPDIVQPYGLRRIDTRYLYSWWWFPNGVFHSFPFDASVLRLWFYYLYSFSYYSSLSRIGRRKRRKKRLLRFPVGDELASFILRGWNNYPAGASVSKPRRLSRLDISAALLYGAPPGIGVKQVSRPFLEGDSAILNAWRSVGFGRLRQPRRYSILKENVFIDPYIKGLVADYKRLGRLLRVVGEYDNLARYRKGGLKLKRNFRKLLHTYNLLAGHIKMLKPRSRAIFSAYYETQGHYTYRDQRALGFLSRRFTELKSRLHRKAFVPYTPIVSQKDKRLNRAYYEPEICYSRTRLLRKMGRDRWRPFFDDASPYYLRYPFYRKYLRSLFARRRRKVAHRYSRYSATRFWEPRVYFGDEAAFEEPLALFEPVDDLDLLTKQGKFVKVELKEREKARNKLFRKAQVTAKVRSAADQAASTQMLQLLDIEREVFINRLKEEYWQFFSRADSSTKARLLQLLCLEFEARRQIVEQALKFSGSSRRELPSRVWGWKAVWAVLSGFMPELVANDVSTNLTDVDEELTSTLHIAKLTQEEVDENFFVDEFELPDTDYWFYDARVPARGRGRGLKQVKWSSASYRSRFQAYFRTQVRKRFWSTGVLASNMYLTGYRNLLSVRPGALPQQVSLHFILTQQTYPLSSLDYFGVLKQWLQSRSYYNLLAYPTTLDLAWATQYAPENLAHILPFRFLPVFLNIERFLSVAWTDRQRVGLASQAKQVAFKLLRYCGETDNLVRLLHLSSPVVMDYSRLSSFSYPLLTRGAVLGGDVSAIFEFDPTSVVFEPESFGTAFDSGFAFSNDAAGKLGLFDVTFWNFKQTGAWDLVERITQGRAGVALDQLFFSPAGMEAQYRYAAGVLNFITGSLLSTGMSCYLWGNLMLVSDNPRDLSLPEGFAPTAGLFQVGLQSQYGINGGLHQIAASIQSQVAYNAGFLTRRLSPVSEGGFGQERRVVASPLAYSSDVDWDFGADLGIRITEPNMTWTVADFYVWWHSAGHRRLLLMQYRDAHLLSLTRTEQSSLFNQVLDLWPREMAVELERIVAYFYKAPKLIREIRADVARLEQHYARNPQIPRLPIVDISQFSYSDTESEDPAIYMFESNPELLFQRDDFSSLGDEEDSPSEFLFVGSDIESDGGQAEDAIAVPQEARIEELQRFGPVYPRFALIDTRFVRAWRDMLVLEIRAQHVFNILRPIFFGAHLAKRRALFGGLGSVASRWAPLPAEFMVPYEAGFFDWGSSFRGQPIPESIWDSGVLYPFDRVYCAELEASLHVPMLFYTGITRIPQSDMVYNGVNIVEQISEFSMNYLREITVPRFNDYVRLHRLATSPYAYYLGADPDDRSGPREEIDVFMDNTLQSVISAGFIEPLPAHRVSVNVFSDWLQYYFRTLYIFFGYALKARISMDELVYINGSRFIELHPGDLVVCFGIEAPDDYMIIFWDTAFKRRMDIFGSHVLFFGGGFHHYLGRFENMFHPHHLPEIPMSQAVAVWKSIRIASWVEFNDRIENIIWSEEQQDRMMLVYYTELCKQFAKYSVALRELRDAYVDLIRLRRLIRSVSATRGMLFDAWALRDIEEAIIELKVIMNELHQKYYNYIMVFVYYSLFGLFLARARIVMATAQVHMRFSFEEALLRTRVRLNLELVANADRVFRQTRGRVHLPNYIPLGLEEHVYSELMVLAESVRDMRTGFMTMYSHFKKQLPELFRNVLSPLESLTKRSRLLHADHFTFFLRRHIALQIWLTPIRFPDSILSIEELYLQTEFMVQVEFRRPPRSIFERVSDARFSHHIDQNTDPIALFLDSFRDESAPHLVGPGPWFNPYTLAVRRRIARLAFVGGPRSLEFRLRSVSTPRYPCRLDGLDIASMNISRLSLSGLVYGRNLLRPWVRFEGNITHPENVPFSFCYNPRPITVAFRNGTEGPLSMLLPVWFYYEYEQRRARQELAARHGAFREEQKEEKEPEVVFITRPSSLRIRRRRRKLKLRFVSLVDIPASSYAPALQFFVGVGRITTCLSNRPLFFLGYENPALVVNTLLEPYPTSYPSEDVDARGRFNTNVFERLLTRTVMDPIYRRIIKPLCYRLEDPAQRNIFFKAPSEIETLASYESYYYQVFNAWIRRQICYYNTFYLYRPTRWPTLRRGSYILITHRGRLTQIQGPLAPLIFGFHFDSRRMFRWLQYRTSLENNRHAQRFHRVFSSPNHLNSFRSALWRGYFRIRYHYFFGLPESLAIGHAHWQTLARFSRFLGRPGPWHGPNRALTVVTANTVWYARRQAGGPGRMTGGYSQVNLESSGFIRGLHHEYFERVPPYRRPADILLRDLMLSENVAVEYYFSYHAVVTKYLLAVVDRFTFLLRNRRSFHSIHLSVLFWEVNALLYYHMVQHRALYDQWLDPCRVFMNSRLHDLLHRRRGLWLNVFGLEHFKVYREYRTRRLWVGMVFYGEMGPFDAFRRRFYVELDDRVTHFHKTFSARIPPRIFRECDLIEPHVAPERHARFIAVCCLWEDASADICIAAWNALSYVGLSGSRSFSQRILEDLTRRGRIEYILELDGILEVGDNRPHRMTPLTWDIDLGWTEQDRGWRYGGP